MPMSPTPGEILAASLFALAILHTFATRLFLHLAHTRPAHRGLWHLLGEVEVAFGFWAMVLVAALFALQGAAGAIAYVEGLNFTEPLFVFAIMVIAGTRPVLQGARGLVRAFARLLPLTTGLAFFWSVLVLVPLLGSFITEPAAMTLAALLLGRDYLGRETMSPRCKYAILGVLFVNISIGGTLTPFAAPPVLMVAKAWGWDTGFMLQTFGYKAALAVALNGTLLTWMFRRELAGTNPIGGSDAPAVPLPLILLHFLLLLGVVLASHYPPLFLGLLLFFLGIAQAYPRHQDPLILREGLLVAFFLAGLVVLGGMQRWWLQPLLLSLSQDGVFVGATLLTAFTDNAALTYLGSLVPNLPASFQYALVAGAVTGGGLTIIANAPNPAGLAILRQHFGEEGVKPLGLLAAALLPTLVAGLAFRCL